MRPIMEEYDFEAEETDEIFQAEVTAEIAAEIAAEEAGVWDDDEGDPDPELVGAYIAALEKDD